MAVPSGDAWNVATLKEYVDRRFVDNGTAVAAALAAAKEAFAKSEENAEKWRAQANEWRGAMTDRERDFASKPGVEAEFKAIRAEIAALTNVQERGAGRSDGIGATWGVLVVVAGLAVAVGAMVARFAGR